MLQIASGKLFTQAPSRRNLLRGILNTNALFICEDAIETAAGRLLPASTLSAGRSHVVYEITECIEYGIGAGRIVSHTIAPYIQDFATIMTVGMNVMCTASYDELRRLTKGQSDAKNPFFARTVVPRVFDESIVIRQDDIGEFVTFVQDLIDLKRECFLVAMRAMRTFSIAMHRLNDDIEVAYTLLVASIESLAQSQDYGVANWEDYEERYREMIDGALATVSFEVARKVRNVLLEKEKLAAGRRFRDFVKSNLDRSFFREEAIGNVNPISHLDLDAVLRQAYAARSGYMHHLSELPSILRINSQFGETTQIEGKTHLTVTGLARIARHLILRYIITRPKQKEEPYDYREELHGVINVNLAPEYWVGDAQNLKISTGNKRLAGFLTQLSSCFYNEEGAKITDLREVLQSIEVELSRADESKRRPFITLHTLYNRFVPEEYKVKTIGSVYEQYADDLNGPSIEGLLVHSINGTTPDWDEVDYDGILGSYYKQSRRKNGLRIPREFEAMMFLVAAEKFRRNGSLDKARATISKAVESHPGRRSLIILEDSFRSDIPIEWFNVIYEKDIPK